MLSVLPPVPDIYCSIYDEYESIGKIDSLDIHSLYTAEINKFASNTRDSRHYYI